MSNNRITERIGNDIHVDTQLYDKTGSVINLSGATLKVMLRSGLSGTIEVSEFAIANNKLKFDILASEMLNAGYYDLIVRIVRADSTIRGGKSTTTVDKRRYLNIVNHDELITED